MQSSDGRTRNHYRKNIKSNTNITTGPNCARIPKFMLHSSSDREIISVPVGGGTHFAGQRTKLLASISFAARGVELSSRYVWV